MCQLHDDHPNSQESLVHSFQMHIELLACQRVKFINPTRDVETALT